MKRNTDSLLLLLKESRRECYPRIKEGERTAKHRKGNLTFLVGVEENIPYISGREEAIYQGETYWTLQFQGMMNQGYSRKRSVREEIREILMKSWANPNETRPSRGPLNMDFQGEGYYRYMYACRPRGNIKSFSGSEKIVLFGDRRMYTGSYSGGLIRELPEHFDLFF